MAMKKIALLASHFEITRIDETAVEQTSKNSKINDLEDGLEYYSALDAGCEVIITEDAGDFYFSEIEVTNCNDFLEKYCSKP